MVILLALPSTLDSVADALSARLRGLLLAPDFMLPPMFIRLAWPGVKERAAAPPPPPPGGELTQLIGGLRRRSEAAVPAPYRSADRRRSREIPFVVEASGPEYEEETRWEDRRRSVPLVVGPAAETRFVLELAGPPSEDSRSLLLATARAVRSLVGSIVFVVDSVSLFEAEAWKEAWAIFGGGGLFSSNGVSVCGFGLDRKDPAGGGERWLPVLSTSMDRSGEVLSLSDIPPRFIRIEGGAESGDPSAAARDGRDLERKPAWNLLGLPNERLEVSGSTKDGLESDPESPGLR